MFVLGNLDQNRSILAILQKGSSEDRPSTIAAITNIKIKCNLTQKELSTQKLSEMCTTSVETEGRQATAPQEKQTKC
jgi:hypothetical protein